MKRTPLRGLIVIVGGLSLAACSCGGEAGENGSNGKDGADGTNGADGTDGVDGGDGTDGVDGADGDVSLVSVTDVEPGAECPLGGVRIEAGLDADGSGELEAGEATESEVVCNQAADFNEADEGVIEDQADLDLLNDDGVNAINGDVTADGGDANSINVPTLTSIGGSLIVESNAALTEVVLPNLETVGGGVSIDDNAALTDINLASLRSVGQDLNIGLTNASLGTLNLGALESVGGSFFLDTGATSTTTALVRVPTNVAGDVIISGNGGLTALVFDNVTIGGDLAIDANGLTEIIVIGTLTVLGDVTITNNADLAQADIDAIFDEDNADVTVGGDVTSNDNG